MNITLLRICVVAMTLGATALPATAQTEQFTRTVAIGETGEVELSNVSGDIVVTADGGGEVRIEVTKRVRGRLSEAQATRQLEAVEVEIEERANRVEVRTRYPRRGRNNRVSVDYDVTVPRGTRVTVTSVSGDVTVRGVEGEVRVRSVSGDVEITEATNLVRAASVSGNVRLNSTASESELEAKSVSGNVRAQGLNAPRLDLATVSGDVNVSDVTCDRADIRSVSGNLDYSGQLSRDGRYQLRSHSGRVRLALTADTGFELEANTFSGSVRSDLPVTLAGTDQGPDRSRRGRRRALVGIYGDGSARLDITTFSGDIIITTR